MTRSEPRAEGLRRIGVVDDAGGGSVSVLVDRDLTEYPEEGAVVYLAATPPAEGLDARKLAPALRRWEERRHPGSTPDAFADDLDDWSAWEAVAQKLIDAALAPEQPE